MNTHSKTFSEFLVQIKQDFPRIAFKRAEIFSWSSDQQTIYYNSQLDDPVWSLLHELGHMTHNHDTYNSDLALVRIEMEAWATAAIIAERYGVTIDDDHIQDCMDSYRFWQQRRSSCPRCELHGVEVTSGNYHCINCRSAWHVSEDRFCRVYRRTLTADSGNQKAR